jgi:hypothetical protein
MVEIIPARKIKIVPWQSSESLVVHIRTKNAILLMGLEKYLKGLERRKKGIVDNSNNKERTTD